MWATLGMVWCLVKCTSSSVMAAIDANSLAYSEDSLAVPSENSTFGYAPYYQRQARDYVPPGGIGGGGGGGTGHSHVQYMTPPLTGHGHHGQTGAYAAPAPAYAPPQSSYGSPAAPIVMQGAYGVPSHYAIPPIVMSSSGGYGEGGYGDDFGGGSDYKELIGLLGLKGLKGLKGVKAVKALKGLGLLALAPILLPLLPLLPIIIPLLLILPILLPLLLLFLIPIPVITIPGGRKKRDVNSPKTARSIFEDTLTTLVSKLPQSISQVPPAHLNECLDTFVCETGELVQRTVPSMMRPAAWLLMTLWPAEMRGKVTIFEKAHNCRERYKCRVKKLENLFNNVVFRESAKLRTKIQEKVVQKGGRVGWGDIIRIIFE